MPWNIKEVEAMRLEFVQLALQPKSNIRDLCRRFNISAPTAYKWIERYRSNGPEGLANQSTRPNLSPQKTPNHVEEFVLELRNNHPDWGGRKLKRRLQDMGYENLPSCSTITEILRRHGRLAKSHEHPGPYKRFCRKEPNELWQMDFKGEFRLHKGWCFPLTLLDDCSRFSLCIGACPGQTGNLVKEQLTTTFRRYGLPQCILSDNGPPWGSSDRRCRYTSLGVWLLRLGIRVSHGRPYHPQTQGKEERFHKTLKAEVLNRNDLHHLSAWQGVFDQWRDVYNTQRPHEALSLDVPASHYQVSPRTFPERFPALEYLSSDTVRTVKSKGEITFANQFYYIGSGFIGLPVGLRSCRADGVFEVFFGPIKIGRIDQRVPSKGKFRCMSVRDNHRPFSFINPEEMC